MITNESLSAAAPLAMLADRKNRSIVPVPGTPLHELYVAILAKSGYDARTTVGEAELGGVFSQFISGSRDLCDMDALVSFNGNNVRTGEIAMLYDRILQLGKESILKQVSFARTVVGPMIESIVASVNGSLLNSTASALTAYRVIPVAKPAVFGNTMFDNAVESSMAVGMTGSDYIFKPVFTLPVKTGEELLEYMYTGANSVDENIRTWVGDKGTDMLREVWNQFFTADNTFGTSGANYGNCIAVMKQRLGENITIADLVTVLFLLTKRVKADVPGGTGVGKSTFDAITDLYMKYSAEAVNYWTKQAAAEISHGALILSVTGKTVFVNAEVYEAWLETEHADVEVILGVMLAGKNYIYINDINEDAETLRRSWKAHVELTKMSEQSMLHIDIVRAMKYHFEQIIRERIGSDTSEKRGLVDAAVKRFDAEINRYTAVEIKGIWTPLIRSVCRAAYPNTDAEEILLGMDDAANSNPDISKRELATIVVAKIINRWIVSQLKVA